MSFDYNGDSQNFLGGNREKAFRTGKEMTFEECHARVLANGSIEWQRFIKRIPLLLLRTYFAAGESNRYQGKTKLIHIREKKDNIVPFKPDQIMFPTIVKEDK